MGPTTSIAINSYETALCIIPPASECTHIDHLRELYDKAYGVWPPHVNMIYPFVAPEHLAHARDCIQKYFTEHLRPEGPFKIKLQKASHFEQRNNVTVNIKETSNGPISYMELLRTTALQALGHSHSPCNLHLTIGQTEDDLESSREFLLAKVRLLPALEFEVGELAILVRNRTTNVNLLQCMRLWGSITLSPSKPGLKSRTQEYWLQHSQPLAAIRSVPEDSENELSTFDREVRSGITFHFQHTENQWTPYMEPLIIQRRLTDLKVSTYNVLVDSVYPPARDRDPLLVADVLSENASCDVLILQEMSDDFLSFLLDDVGVRKQYPFSSHGPPHQPEVGPLPSLRNIVVLSRYPFSWKNVPFHRRHKAALVAKFHCFNNSAGTASDDIIIAGVHLTCGLTDGSVAAKKAQLKSLSNYLTQHHATQPWIIAGDFNITTSTYTIEMALKNKSISSQTVAALSALERNIIELGLIDAWTICQSGDSHEGSCDGEKMLYQGEESATFDPQNNALAATTSGSSNHRPQRYDRILVKPRESLQVIQFNHFGSTEASDHAGLRATVKMLGVVGEVLDPETIKEYTIQRRQALSSMDNMAEFMRALADGCMLTTDAEAAHRQEAFELLKHVLLGTTGGGDTSFADIPMKLVSVGSYALGLWTRNSDIDCLCIGAISSKTFFKLARQRLLRSEHRGIRILRMVEANTGTMLEVSVNGIAVDLQYCPASRIVERWSDHRSLPATDPVFSLPVLSLRKLKPYRDLMYLQQTLPDLSIFRLAYRCIKLWAVRRGLYSSKFGYFSGTHITIMLSWVYKRVVYEKGPISAFDLIVTFFHHYAHFNWAENIVFDAFFYKRRPRYYRTSRDPMVILGHHTPNSNIAHTATIPSVRTLITELRLATQLLQQPGNSWNDFFSHSNSTSLFLQSYQSFVKIDIQFWGRTLSKGKSLVGWVESRCVGLVVDINRALPEFGVRIWPSRFTNTDSESDEKTADYYGCYLIGLSRTSKATFPSSGDDDRQHSKQSLDKVLHRFLTLLRTDEKNYDRSTCWVDVSVVKSNGVRDMRRDDREWGEYVTELEPDSDDGEDDEIAEAEQFISTTVTRILPQRPKPTSTPLAASKLRPASDVLNRLRWDPTLDPGEYIIGYEDRFLGAKEISLERWKTEQTDEEFIPQHRILYFKKRGGQEGKGEVVWERTTRIDQIFGSGAGAGTKVLHVE
ncbi:hypothetical protein ACN47E_001378 [Coniothyrium glycines]